MKINVHENSNAAEAKPAAVETMFGEALVNAAKPGSTHNQCAVAVGKNGMVKGHLPHGKFHMYSISEERWSYSFQSNWTIKI